MADKRVPPLTGAVGPKPDAVARLLGDEEIEEMTARRKERAKRRAQARRAKETKK
jgi:hypothetical protein